MIKHLKTIIIFTLVPLFLHNCFKNHEVKEELFSIQCFKINDGWGYNIGFNGKKIIYQPFIPVITKKIPFRNKETALKAAKLVVDKLRNKTMPTLSEAELIHCNVLKRNQSGNLEIRDYN